jgi:hypothetical protein
MGWWSTDGGLIAVAESAGRHTVIARWLIGAAFLELLGVGALQSPATPTQLTVAWMTGVAALTVWGVARAWRMTLYIDDEGLAIRNPLRTYRASWLEILRLRDGLFDTGEGGGDRWVLEVVRPDGRVIKAIATVRWQGRPEVVAAVNAIACRFGVEAHLTGITRKRDWWLQRN